MHHRGVWEEGRDGSLLPRPSWVMQGMSVGQDDCPKPVNVASAGRCVLIFAQGVMALGIPSGGNTKLESFIAN